ncbi:MAG: MATE family efflux transporter [Blautia sp.]|nr:MATE family efflux transporter [Blautia sp.]
MTEGKISKSIALFALPIMGGLILQMLYNTVDGIVVGNFVGENALGAVNTSGAFVNLLVSISNGLAGGSSVYLAQLFGAREKERLHRAMSTMLLMMIGIGVILTVTGELIADIVLRNMLNVPEQVYGWAMSYLRIYLLGLICVFLYNAMASALRSVGDSKAAMYMLIISSVANIVLDLIFVVLFGWGVIGVAVATVLAQLIAVLLCLVYVKKKQPLLFVQWNEISFNKSDCSIYLKTGIPLAIQYIISNTGALAVQRLVNSYGESFMASVAAASKIEIYAVIPIMCFAQTMTVFSGQNIGANQPERVRKGLHASWAMSLTGCLVLTMVFLFGSKPLIMLFGCRGEVLEIGVQYLHFVPVSLFFAAFMYTTKCALQGAGDIKVPLVFTFVTLFLRVVAAYAMAATPIGYRAVWIATAVDFGAGAILNLIRFRGGKWKYMKTF